MKSTFLQAILKLDNIFLVNYIIRNHTYFFYFRSFLEHLRHMPPNPKYIPSGEKQKVHEPKFCYNYFPFFCLYF